MWTIPIGQNNCPYVHFLRGYKIKKGQFINITKNKTHNCEDPKKKKRESAKECSSVNDITTCFPSRQKHVRGMCGLLTPLMRCDYVRLLDQDD